jgi:hypothetical protein
LDICVDTFGGLGREIIYPLFIYLLNGVFNMAEVLGFKYLNVPLGVSTELVAERARRRFGVTTLDAVRNGGEVEVRYVSATSRMQKDVLPLTPSSTLEWENN